MSDKCHFCGAGKDGTDKDGNSRFSCLSWSGPHCVGNECQSDRCKDRQITQLKAHNEKLERVIRALKQYYGAQSYGSPSQIQKKYVELMKAEADREVPDET